MGIPYEKSVDVVASSAVDSYHTIPFPHRGQITKLLAVQSSGNAEGFAVELYNSADAVPEGGSASSSAGDGRARDNFVIIPEVTAGGGATTLHEAGSYNYSNRDGSPTNPQRFLYLRITPEGTGDKDFTVTLTVDQTTV
jgi:hypothetical protein